MKPLSVFKYYINNRKRFFAVFTAVFASVFLLYAIQMLVDSTFHTTELAYVEPQKYYTSITPKGALIDPELVDSIRRWDCVNRVIPWVFQYINYNCIISGETGTRVFTVYTSNMSELMSLLNVRLTEGRLPNPDSKEIAVHHLLAKNKGISVGDSIGSHIDRNEALKGNYRIVGLLDGKSIVSFTCIEKWMEDNEVYDPFRFGIIILPAKGRMQEMNKRLEYLPLMDLELRTTDIVKDNSYQSTKGFIMILNVINLVVILIVSLCVGFLTYIYMYQRRREFGLLNAMGYTRQEVLLRSCLEISILCFIGFLCGVLAAVLFGAIIDGLLFSPRGQIIRLWNLSFFIKTVCVPLFAALFSIIPVWRLLAGLDPVSILEGGDE